MRALCAWCQREGLPAFFGEREPLGDLSETHGICAGHEAREQVLLAIHEARRSGFSSVQLDGRAKELGGWRIASLRRMRVYAFPLSCSAELFAHEGRGMVIRGGEPAQHALSFQDLGSLFVPLTRVAVEAAHD